jgi:CheY-like chemotaxis protein
LWVDDRPTANVFERESLLEEGWDIDQAISTRQAVEIAGGRWSRYTAVITDMGRDEDGHFVADAGLQLIRRIREETRDLPIVVYTGPRGLEWREAALEGGANALTSSPTELLASVRATALG